MTDNLDDIYEALASHGVGRLPRNNEASSSNKEMTADEALEKESQPYRIPTNVEIALAAEVRRLREENRRLNEINTK